MHKKVIIFLTLLIPALLSSCTHCDGDIGTLFGSWHVEAIERNGVADENYNANLLVSFQGEICNFAYINLNEPDYDEAEIFGTWSRDGNALTLRAGYMTTGGATLPQYFDPFPVSLEFPYGENSVSVSITSENSRTMVWAYTTPDGTAMTYRLRKYP